MTDNDTAYPYDDEDNVRWERRFGAPYVEDDQALVEFDDETLSGLEREFHRAGAAERSPYGALEPLDEDGSGTHGTGENGSVDGDPGDHPGTDASAHGTKADHGGGRV